MKIIVIVKLVPDSRVAVRVRPDGSDIETEGLKHVCDPFDEIAVEAAVQLKAQRPDVEEVAAMTIGPSGAVDALRHALAMGADRATHVLDETMARHEELRAASVCAAALLRAPMEWGLILCGCRSTDSGAGEFGPALAESLGVAHAGAVTNLEVRDDGGSVRAVCRVEGGERVVDVRTPAVVTCERGLAEPRRPALPKLMKAKKQAVEVIDAGGLEAGATFDPALTRLTPPPGRQACRIIDGDPAAMAREVARLLREEAKVI